MALRYLLYDLVGRDFVDEAPFETFEYTEALNKPGGWSATVKIDHPKASAGNLKESATAVFVDRDKSLIFGGILWDSDAQVAENATLRVGGQGFFSYYRDDHRFLRSRSGMVEATGANALEITFTNEDVFAIVNDLLAHAATFPGDVGFDDVRYFGPGVGGLSGVLKSQTYWAYELKNIGAAIEDLATQDPGFDFVTTVGWLAGEPVRYLDLHYPRKGADTGGLVFEDRKNIKLVKRAVRGGKTANVITTTGAGTGDTLLTAEASALDLIAPGGRYPRLEGIRSYRDEAILANLSAHASADLSASKLPVETLEVEVIEDIGASVTSFGLGDTAHVIAHRGFVNVDGDYRITARTINFNAEGHPTIKVALADEAATLGE